MTNRQPDWSEENSLDFLKYGNYFVPGREEQIRVLCDLLASPSGPGRILELCCGAGLLTEAILSAYPACRAIGLDASPTMLQHAAARLKPFGERFQPGSFNLQELDWRDSYREMDAILSSLSIHHLDAAQKQRLFLDCWRMLKPGGVLAIADLIEPAAPVGRQIAAEAWDEAVRERARRLDGNEAAFTKFKELGWNYFRYPDEMDKPSGLFEMLQWLRAVGFEYVDVFWLRAGHAVFGGFKPGASA